MIEKPMRLCFLASGDSIHSYRWVKYFADRRHTVHWISLVPNTFDPIQNVFFRDIGQSTIKAVSLFRATIQLKKLLQQIRPDIVHAHSVGSYGILGAMSQFHPFVATAWGSDVLFAANSWIKGPFVRHALNKADLITCDADHMIDAMVRHGVAKLKLRLIHFGTDTHIFCPKPPNDELREQLGVFKSPAMISLRNFYPVHDLESLIRAVSSVLKEIPDAKFVIAGSGPQEKMLKELTRSLSVSDSVRFIGRVENDKLPEYLTSMDAYVSTSLSDAGIAASTAEAMACGLPVIVTGTGENRKWVQDGENGFVIPPKDPKALVDKIVYLLKDGNARSRFGKINRDIIKERNNYHKEMDGMERIYHEILKEQ